ncbi:ArdC family protein [Polymorphum gilvum]|uniref:Peptidase M, neutral zinc metallopeptidase, zinc-binding site n=1 Tax=Polymorphum gilvum (strain LMG 25793 / CGMCC 1.9160 / SL003B-26A1) TaxID=991905 RepID=F2J4U3_POLGS|nr:zincin-like metallopeptidase domain-containing protein [Polymorphum gilvum]ADZ69035.1 Peptidase M, neutral zinc metallopeptidase, zinc-binding site [Polymorphum gilvum SL003B-26A1]
MTTERIDVYTQVTNNIIAAIEAGAGDWQMPWHRSGEGLNRPVNIDTSKAYRGINVVSLWASAQARGFITGTWGTYRQWQANGCQVRKGEKSSLVVFYKEFEVEERNDTGETEHGKRLMARASWVFNADQVDGYEAPALPEPKDPVATVAAAERFITATGAIIRHGGTRAFYRPSDDIIQMPERERFLGTETSTATESYYATLLHELTHWTGDTRRCDRQFGKRFGDDAYAVEELVAELGAAFLCADLGVTLTPRPDHAAYIDSWLKVLKADKKAIFAAASAAAKATDFLAGLQATNITEAAA